MKTELGMRARRPRPRRLWGCGRDACAPGGYGDAGATPAPLGAMGCGRDARAPGGYGDAGATPAPLGAMGCGRDARAPGGYGDAGDTILDCRFWIVDCCDCIAVRSDERAYAVCPIPIGMRRPRPWGLWDAGATPAPPAAMVTSDVAGRMSQPDRHTAVDRPGRSGHARRRALPSIRLRVRQQRVRVRAPPA